jgi:hypothetical protein
MERQHMACQKIFDITGVQNPKLLGGIQLDLMGFDCALMNKVEVKSSESYTFGCLYIRLD